MNRFLSQYHHPVPGFLSIIIMLQVALFQCVPGFAADEVSGAEAVSTADQEPKAIAVDAALSDVAAEAESEESEEEYEYIPRGMPLPPAEVTIAGRFGDGLFENYGGVLVPLHYGDDFGLLYINPRYSVADYDEETFNLGLGWRNIFEVNDYDFILGGNVFYDSRWTQFNNQFDQLGLGAEFLSKWVDARYNYYLPDDDRKKARSFETEEVRTSTSTRSSSSTSLSTNAGPITPSGYAVTQTATTTARTLTRTTRTTTTTTTRFLFEQFEAALEGFDAEIGFLVPLIDQFVPTRIFIGYQDFQNPFGEDFDGLKGRLEARLLPGLTLDVELFEDEVLNGTDYYIGARAHVPLDLQNLANGRNPFEGTAERFKPSSEEADLARRLTENVIRDPRVLTGLSDLIENVAARKVSSRSHSSTTTSDSTQVVGSETFVLFRGIFVNNANTSGIEDGTFENPWNTIQEGVDATGPAFNNNVYTFKGTGPYRENVVVAKNNVNLRSEAKPLIGLGGTVFGGTGMRPVVDGNVAGVNGPAFRISGQNVTVDAYEIIRSPGGSNPGLTDITGNYDIDGAGIVAENASGLNLVDVKTTGNTYGALIVHDGSQPGAPADFTQVIKGLDAAGNSVANLAVDAMGAGGAMNLAVMGSDLSGGGGDGLQIFAEGFDTAAISLEDLAAGGNAGDGIIADVTANGPVLVDLINVDTSGNGGDGLGLTAESLADAVTVALQGVASDGNGGDGIVVDATGAEGASVAGEGLSVDGNGGDGLVVDADGGNGPALIDLEGVSAVGNGGLAVDTNAESAGDEATVLVSGVDASGGAGDGLTVTADGADGATVLVEGVVADNNAGEGIVIDADGGAGPVDVAVLGASASGNQGGDGVDIGIDGDGPVMLTVADVMANENRDRGVNLNARSDGDITADLSSIVATLNGAGPLGLGLTPAGEGIRAVLRSRDGQVNITGSQLAAIGNQDDGILVRVLAETGATVDLSQVQADMNRFDGLDVFTRAKGPVEATLNGITADGNGLDPLFGARGIEVNLRSTDSTALLTGNNLSASDNDGDGIKTRVRGEMGAAAVLGGLVADNNDGEGIDIDVINLDLFGSNGPASLSLSNASASNNRFDGVDARVVSDGAVDVTADTILADGNGTDLILGGDGIRMRGISYNDTATISGTGLSASGNDGDGIKARFTGNTGATAVLGGLVADNNDGEGIDINVFNLDLLGVNGPATLSLSNASAGNNRFDGVDARVVSDGPVDVTLASILADGNGTDLLLRGDGVKVRAISYLDSATVNGTGLSATGNDGDGIDARSLALLGSAASVIDGATAIGNRRGIVGSAVSLDGSTLRIAGSTANDNSITGIKGITYTSLWLNDILYDISGSTADNNGWNGVDSLLVQPINRTIVTTGATATGNGLFDFIPLLP